MHCWSFTKGEAGARVEMETGDWNKEQLDAEVQAHDDIIAHTPMLNKLRNSPMKRRPLAARRYKRRPLAARRLVKRWQQDVT